MATKELLINEQYKQWLNEVEINIKRIQLFIKDASLIKNKTYATGYLLAKYIKEEKLLKELKSFIIKQIKEDYII